MDVEERKEREICEYGRELTEDERRELGARDGAADASAAELRAQREALNLELERHKDNHGHYPTKGFPEVACILCRAAAAKAAKAADPEAPVELHGEAIECPQCKHVMLRTEIADYRAHGQECVAYEIRTRRNEATLSTLAQRLVAAEQHADRLERVIMETGQERQQLDLSELRKSLHALASYILEPGECMAPEECGGSDLCPCRTDGTFHGTCGVDPFLVQLLNEHIARHPWPWRHHKLNQGRDPADPRESWGIDDWREHCRRITIQRDREFDRIEALEVRLAKAERTADAAFANSGSCGMDGR